MKRTYTTGLLISSACVLALGCSSGLPSGETKDAGATGGSSNLFGGNAAGGQATGGTNNTSNSGATTVVNHTGGAIGTGGTAASGGSSSNASSSASGGVSNVGGNADGGVVSAGGTTSNTGGSTGCTVAPTTAPVVACDGQTVPQVSGNLSINCGYVTAGALHGYGFTWSCKGSSCEDSSTSCVTPKCDSTGCQPQFDGTALCAAGVVRADATNTSVIGIGFNFNQPNGGGTADSVAAPANITVTVSKGAGAGDAALRVEVADNASNDYCVDAGNWTSGVAIPITRFNTKCWDGSGTALTAGTPLTKLELLIPCDATSDRPFADCLTGVTLSPSQGTGGAPSTGGASSTGGTSPTGGAPATGGVMSSGGAPATGGAPSTGGDTSSGGTTTAGGGGGTDIATGCGAVTGTVYFCDDFENGLSKWVVSGQDWNTATSTSRSPTHSATDSPDGNYAAGVNVAMTMATSVDLTSATAPVLAFWYKLALGWWTSVAYCQGNNSSDTVDIQLSADSGSSWRQVATWTCAQGTTSWSPAQFDLSSYVGKRIKIRFGLQSAGNSTLADGWYIDDVVIQEAN